MTEAKPYRVVLKTMKGEHEHRLSAYTILEALQQALVLENGSMTALDPTTKVISIGPDMIELQAQQERDKTIASLDLKRLTEDIRNHLREDKKKT